MTPVLTLDIETIPSQQPGLKERIRETIKPPGNISKADTIAKWMTENTESAAEEAFRKTACDGTQGEIVCISYAIEACGVRNVWRDLNGSETDLLYDFFRDVREMIGDQLPFFVGHNILGFDLRFIFQRCVIRGVKPPFPLRQDARYNGDHVFDTMLAWAGWGNRVKLATICEVLGIPVKSDGIDGSRVWDAVLAGNADRVAAYCNEDVEATREVYRRMTFQERREAA